MSNKQSDPSSFNIFALTALTFIVLKLCNVINWCWWWVLSPLWIPLALAFVALVIIWMFNKW